jgi:hypothetical protein
VSILSKLNLMMKSQYKNYWRISRILLNCSATSWRLQNIIKKIEFKELQSLVDLIRLQKLRNEKVYKTLLLLDMLNRNRKLKANISMNRSLWPNQIYLILKNQIIKKIKCISLKISVNMTKKTKSGRKICPSLTKILRKEKVHIILSVSQTMTFRM